MKISVLTPSFNAHKTLQRAIDSVIEQSYKDWEHIIVDADSNDGTKEILKSNKHIKWVSEADKGQSDAMNKAFNMSSGDLIVYLNADDYFYPNAFATVINTFKNNLTIDIVVGNIDCWYQGNLKTHSDFTLSWREIAELKGRFPLNPVGYFYKREVQRKIGNFPIEEHFTMDYWFLLRAFYFFKAVKTESILGVFVFSEDNKSSRITSEYGVQVPHAINFCLKHTPWRLFYISYKLLTHPKRNITIFNLLKKGSINFVKRINFK